MHHHPLRLLADLLLLVSLTVGGCSSSPGEEDVVAWSSCTLDGDGMLEMEVGTLACDGTERGTSMWVRGDGVTGFGGVHAIGPSDAGFTEVAADGSSIAAVSGTISVSGDDPATSVVTWAVTLADGRNVSGSSALVYCGDRGHIC